VIKLCPAGATGDEMNERKLAEQERLVSQPRYNLAEAAHLAGLSTSTARRWLVGYAFQTSAGLNMTMPPVAKQPTPDALVSFLDLVDLVAIKGFREAGYPLPTVRKVVDYCRDEMKVERPLGSVSFKVGGRDVFVSHGDELLEVGHGRGRLAWAEVLEPFLRQLDYGPKFATRWWPLGREQEVVVDPAFGFGLPVVAGTGVRTEILFERFSAGELIAEIADDFSVSELAVQRALQYEHRLRAA
jgi:uncharacterized protein (DUF433 family)